MGFVEGLLNWGAERLANVCEKVGADWLADTIRPERNTMNIEIQYPPLPKNPPHSTYELFSTINYDKPRGKKAFDGLFGLDEQISSINKYRNAFRNEYYDKNLMNRTKKAQFVIFSGPPGCGKTELSKRIADAFGVNLAIIEAGHIRGTSKETEEVRLREIAKCVRNMTSAVVLIDEIDHLIGRDDNKTSIRSQFRQIIDGPTNFFEDSNILFIGTTNRLEQIEEDILSRCEVIPFYKPDKNALYDIIKTECKLKDMYIKELTKQAFNYKLSGRHVVKCADECHLKYFGNDINDFQRQYYTCYESCFERKKNNMNLKESETSWFF